MIFATRRLHTTPWLLHASTLTLRDIRSQDPCPEILRTGQLARNFGTIHAICPSSTISTPSWHEELRMQEDARSIALMSMWSRSVERFPSAILTLLCIGLFRQGGLTVTGVSAPLRSCAAQDLNTVGPQCKLRTLAAVNQTVYLHSTRAKAF